MRVNFPADYCPRPLSSLITILAKIQRIPSIYIYICTLMSNQQLDLINKHVTTLEILTDS